MGKKKLAKLQAKAEARANREAVGLMMTLFMAFNYIKNLGAR